MIDFPEQADAPGADAAPVADTIAVIGMEGRFPGAGNLGEFWRNLRAGAESVRASAPNELDAAGVPEGMRKSPNFVNAASAVDGIEFFDAAFFGYSAREAQSIDPQQRVFLECCWKALEDAGYGPFACASNATTIGVWAGSATSTYLHYLYANPEFVETVGHYQIALGNEKDHLANRVSFKLNLRGPSVNVQTACSTSLVSVCCACQALLQGQCDMALAGGVCIRVPQTYGYLWQPSGILSPDGHCRAFDAGARGTVPGNGAGVVVLKRLADAQADGDHIHALIRGTAVNNDGADKSGYTAPSINGQAEVIAMAHALARVDPATITYVEAHGTGTILGDPIEVAALTQAFRVSTQKTGFCAIGSVKSNIGHLDPAAGIAGLIKAILALKHGELPPTLHFQEANPHIDFAGSPFYVNAALAPWPRGASPRRAGVSSFGIGGTNAHAVLEEAPAPEILEGASAAAESAVGGESAANGCRWQLIPLSANSALALEALTDAMARNLAEQPPRNLENVAFTLQVGRRHGPHRRAVVCADPARMAAALRPAAGLPDASGGRDALVMNGQSAASPTAAFLFPGQGSQHLGMGAELYGAQPAFREALDRCAELFRPHLGMDLRRWILCGKGVAGRGADGREDLQRELDQTANSQPALFSVEYALASLWADWGVRPDAMLGHSVGEYVAACLAGVFVLGDAVALIAERGRLMQELAPGAMLAVALPEPELERQLQDDPAWDEVALAAVNGPTECVVSGPARTIDALAAHLHSTGASCIRLRASHAFHSAMMDAALAPFARCVASLPRSAPRIRFLSNLTGTWITDRDATDPDYWARQLRSTVRFDDGLQVLAEMPNVVLLECGPDQVLSTLVRHRFAAVASTDRGANPVPPKAIASLPRGRGRPSEQSALLSAAARLWTMGVGLDWPRLHSGRKCRRVPLPTYPFERRRHWVGPLPAAAPVLQEGDGTTETGSNPAGDHIGNRQDHDPAGNGNSNGRRNGSAPGAPDDGASAETVDSPGSPARSLLYYAPAWHPRPLEPQAAGAKAGRARWLIFGDDCGVAGHLERRLLEAGHHVAVVTPANVYAKDDARRYRMDIANLADYATLLEDFAGPRAPVSAVHLLGLTARETRPGLDDDRHERLGFQSLSALGRALGDRRVPSQIMVASTSMQRLTDDDRVVPEKALLVGPCRVIPQEYPGIRCRCVDVPPPADDADAAALAAILSAELECESAEPFAAIRGTSRFVQAYEPSSLERPRSKAPWRTGGVYLITGGLSGIGLAFAEHVGRRYRAKLVLTRRSSFPPPREWDDLLSSGGPSEADGRETGVIHAVRVIRRIEEAGGQVLALQADITDEAGMRETLALARRRFGAINGVIHSAGVAARSMMFELSRESVEAVLAPKVSGTRVLRRLLADEPVDWLVLFSSLSSILGGVGSCGYAAANAYLDAVAQAGSPATRVLSINWPTWREVGMAVAATRKRGRDSLPISALQEGIWNREGIHALEQALASDLRQVLVVPAAPGPARAPAPEIAPHGAPEAPHRTPSAEMAEPMPSDGAADTRHVRRALAGIWERLLGVDAVRPEDNFFELGGHSLLGLQVASRIRALYSVELSLRDLFEAPTLAGLALIVEGALLRQARSLPDADTRADSSERRVGCEAADE
jgi:phthiocerol/phenolphthiocerol synthesis type-I polyketide synthase E